MMEARTDRTRPNVVARIGSQPIVLAAAIDQRIFVHPADPGGVGPERRAQLGRDVQAWVQERAASYKVPRTLCVLAATDLPLTPTGKVSKRLLKEQMQLGDIDRVGARGP